MRVEQAKLCHTCGVPIGWAEGSKVPRDLDGTPHVCTREYVEPAMQNTDAPNVLVDGALPQIVTKYEGTKTPPLLPTPDYFAATVGWYRWAQFNHDLYEAGMLLKSLGFFDGDEGWCARVREATERLDEDVRLTAWLRIGKALLMAMCMDGSEECASETLREWTEWWRNE